MFTVKYFWLKMSPIQNSRMHILYLTRFATTPLTMIKHKFKLSNNSTLPTQRLLQLSAIHMSLLSDRLKKKKSRKKTPQPRRVCLYPCHMPVNIFEGFRGFLLEKIKLHIPHICSEKEMSTIFILHILLLSGWPWENEAQIESCLFSKWHQPSKQQTFPTKTIHPGPFFQKRHCPATCMNIT